MYGVISEKQIGLDPMTGRPKLAKEVLEGMRRYCLMVANGQERIAREERIQSSLKDLENDHIGQKIYLRMEPMPLISKNLDEDKDIVFDFTAQQFTDALVPKLMSGAIDAGKRILRSGKELTFQEDFMRLKGSAQYDSFQEGSTGFSICLSKTSASGTNLKKSKARKRPGT